MPSVPEPEKLNKCFFRLQFVLECAIAHKGGGRLFSIFHIGKGKMLALGELPLALPCAQEAAHTANVAVGLV